MGERPEVGRIQGRVVSAGRAQGEVVYTDEPLSFWGGYSAREGKIIDTRHALYGQHVAGKILVLPGARGSSTGSGILLEAIRLGSAPAALVLRQADAILALGAIVGRELYDKALPVVVVTEADFARLHKATHAAINERGEIVFEA